jgi:hypothetical protein
VALAQVQAVEEGVHHNGGRGVEGEWCQGKAQRIGTGRGALAGDGWGTRRHGDVTWLDKRDMGHAGIGQVWLSSRGRQLESPHPPG